MNQSRLAAILRRRFGRGRSGAQVVDELFRSVLLRPADQESLDYYVKALGRGVALERVVGAIDTSVEAVENSWRAPVASALGPALLAQGAARPVFVAAPPGHSAGATDLVGPWLAAAGPPVVLGGVDLDQLYWTPALVRRRAGLVTGPLGRTGRALVAPDALSAVVVARPGSPSGGDAQARGLLGWPWPGRPWVDFDPAAEARRRGLDAAAPLQALNQAGPEDLDEASVAVAAVEALDAFELVLVRPGPPADGPEGAGPDWELYRAARARAAPGPQG